MRKTLLFSISLAVLLNLWQFASSYRQQQAAFAPAWASSTTAPSPQPAKAAHTITPQPAEAATAAPSSEPVAATPDPSLAIATRLTQANLKSDAAALYLAVQASTGTPWQLLAAVHSVETGQRGDTTVTSSAGAQGPMQFMPATFRAYALDGDGNGTRQITDLDDAMYTAGRYLAAGGATKGNYRNALYNYNHSNAYVDHVMRLAHQLGL